VFASIAALVLVTGSTFVWLHKKVRSTPDLKAACVVLDTYPDILSSDPPPSEKAHATEQASEEAENRQDAGVANAESGLKDAKSARSKERRKRGKDPLKGILKGGKKNKSLQRLVKSLASDDPTRADLPHPIDYRDDFAGMSSRSSSAASSTSQRKSSLSLEISDETNASTSGSSSECQQEAPVSQNPTITASVSEPNFETVQDREDHSKLLPTSRSDCSRLLEREVEFSGNRRFGHSLSSSSTSCCDSTSDSYSPSTKETSPSPSLKLEIPSFLRTSQSLPLNTSSLTSNNASSSSPRSSRAYESSKPSNSSFQGPWDWDGQPTAHSPTTYTKPPRFRSQAKHIPISISASPLTGPTPYMSQYFTPYSPPPTTPPHPFTQTSTETTDAPNFIFPTLNPSSASSSPPPSARLPGNVGATPARCTSSPPRSPHSSSPLSAQTQIASLRGALEAARIREEKSKQRADKLARDYETLKRKWGEELYNWRGQEAAVRASLVFLLCA
jgi:anthranilate synthase/indole-3-glycerol phosphate synthase/phosphoribosylanthranilate isomerase